MGDSVVTSQPLGSGDTMGGKPDPGSETRPLPRGLRELEACEEIEIKQIRSAVESKFYIRVYIGGSRIFLKLGGGGVQTLGTHFSIYNSARKGGVAKKT